MCHRLRFKFIQLIIFGELLKTSMIGRDPLEEAVVEMQERRREGKDNDADDTLEVHTLGSQLGEHLSKHRL